jgi:hypothetical protein
MKNMILILSVFMMTSLAGCAIMEKALPPQLDANGNPIPGTHQAIPIVNTVAGVIPYGIGQIAVAGILLAWNGYEKYKSYKIGKGLSSTLSALNQVKNDPALKANWEQIQQILSDAHTVANVQPLIKNFLAKV